WVGESIDLYEGDTRLPAPSLIEVRASLPSDRSFGSSYAEALAHVTGPRLPPDIDLPWTEGLLDVLFDYPIQSDRSRFSIDSRLADDLGGPAGPARRRRAAVRVPRQRRVRAARPALASGGAPVRDARLRAHPRRHRPPAVPVLPGDSVPPDSIAGRGGDGVHGS